MDRGLLLDGAAVEIERGGTVLTSKPGGVVLTDSVDKDVEVYKVFKSSAASGARGC